MAASVKPISGTGASISFKVLTDEMTNQLFAVTQLTKEAIDFEPGKTSFEPISFTTTIDTEVWDEAMRNMYNSMFGLPPQYKLPPREPSCEWMKNDE